MRTIRNAAAAAFLLLFTLVALPSAHAEGKAWAAIKAKLPSDMFVVGGGNFATVRASAIYKKMAAEILGKDDDIQEGLGLIKKSCGVDALKVVDEVVVAIESEQKEEGIIVIALKGVNEAKVLSCLQKAAKKKEKTAKITASKTGNVVAYEMVGESEKLYVAWLSKDVIALTTDPTDRAMLDRFLGGSGVAGAAGTALGKVNTSAAVWGVVTKATPIDKYGTMKLAQVTANLAKGTVTVDVSVVMDSAKSAKSFAADAQSELAKNVGQLPPAMQAVAKTVTIAAAGDTITVKASATEKELLTIAEFLIKQM